MAPESPLDPALVFFDGVRRDEPRLRWDRLVALHLVTCAFLNAIGYDVQRTTDEELARVARRIRNPQVAHNLAAALPRLGLGHEQQARRLIRVLTAPTSTPEAPDARAAVAPR